MRYSNEETNSEVITQNLDKRTESRKDLTVAFETKLNNIKENEEETPLKRWEIKNESVNGGHRTRRKDERAKSAGCEQRRKLELGWWKRPKSTESFRGRVRAGQTEFGAEMKEKHTKRKQMFEVREICCRGGCASLQHLDSRRSTVCECDWWMTHNCCNPEKHRRRCRSNPNFTNEFFEKEKELHKMKRSLRLIGLELSDLGIHSKNRMEVTPRCRINKKTSALSTKVTQRRFSLESLREAIRNAWLDDRMDESHRKLISQAAYEEWYFKKEKELQTKLEQERQNKAEAQESLRKELERKKAKAEEEFRKWIQRKKIKNTNKKENSMKRSGDSYDRRRKTKEDSEAAFLKWKKEKDKELEKRMLEKKKEKEQKIASEREKNEKKKIAEKAFQQWKIKLEESEKLKEKRRQELKRKQEELKRRQEQEERSQISFQVWKKLKDEEIHQRLKHFREMTELEKKERQTRLEEKLYEAEQAFEDWLEKVDTRKQKQFCDSFQKVPWIPV